jgi:hypothetical protein
MQARISVPEFPFSVFARRRKSVSGSIQLTFSETFKASKPTATAPGWNRMSPGRRKCSTKFCRRAEVEGGAATKETQMTKGRSQKAKVKTTCAP